MSVSRADAFRARLAEEELGADLWSLIGAVGVPLVTATLVTTVPSAGNARACFRLTFTDGTVLKGRRVETEAEAERIDILGSFLDPRYFPRVLVRRGRALLTDWINGSALQSDGSAAELVRRCGGLHRRVHDVVLTSAASRLRRQPLGWEPWLDASLRELVEQKAVDLGLAKRISLLAVRHAPPASRSGLCHGDFCAENIIVSPAGAIWVVDNDGIAVNGYAHDLARTWYRWPMVGREQHAYAEGYGPSGQGREFAAHFVHWALLILVGSCKFRVRARSDSMRIPLGCLRAVVESEGRAENLPRLLGKGGDRGHG